MIALVCATRFLTWCGWGVLIPFLAVWLHGLDVLPGTGIAVVVGAAIIANRVGALPFAGQLGRYDKRLVTAGCQLTAVAATAAMAALAHHRSGALAGWLAAAVVFGLASSIATVAQIAYLAGQFDPESSQQAFSYENVAVNLGGGIAPLLSAVVLVGAPGAFPYLPMAFALAGAALCPLMPPEAPGRPPDQEETVHSGHGVRPFLVVNFLTLVAYAQFADVFPAYGSGVLGARAVGVLFTVSCAAIVVLQVPLTRVSTRLGAATQVCLANLTAAAGSLLLMDPRGGLPLVCLAVCLVTVAEMSYGPLYQAMAVRAFGGDTTTALAVLTFVWGVAESLATLVGLWLVAAHRGHLSMLLGALAALTVAVYAAYPRRVSSAWSEMIRAYR
jgi:MFS family permease